MDSSASRTPAEKTLLTGTNEFYSGLKHTLKARKPGTNSLAQNGTTTMEYYLELEHGPRQIAICGMAMRLPGGIHNDQDFWDVLVNGKDTRGPVPPDRYSAQGFTDKIGHREAIKTQCGYFIDADLASLDTSFFTMTKTELERTDPQQRQLLEITREVLENAGEVSYRGDLIGCYVGNFGEDWLQMSAKENQHVGGYMMCGHSDMMLANRISFEYDLKGPSMVIKTGCSASLVALHEACRAIQFGDCKAAIIAGTNLILCPATTAALDQEGVLSPEGSCKTFDANADGFARGEAITAVYVKSLENAIEDRNPIRAIIRNTGTNSDGKDQGLMTPSGKSHEALMKKVYAEAGLNPTSTGFIETSAIGEIFGISGVYIGSVKPNVGHSGGASGVTSLIKAVLALEHNIIPPNIKFSTPSLKIPFIEKNLKVPLKATPWPAGRKKRVSINSFAVGGSNAHVILDAAEQSLFGEERIQDESDSRSQVAFISANTQDSAQEYIERIRSFIEKHPRDVNDMAYTLAFRREDMLYRAYLITDGTSNIEVSSVIRTPNQKPNIVMVFSGDGAQWPRMGKELLQSDMLFKRDIRKMDKILQSLLYPPKWSIEEELQKSAKRSKIDQAQLAQPLTTAIQIAIANRLQRIGIEPSTVVGHSSGEIAAAYASGSLSLTEALAAAYYRGFVAGVLDLVGGMAAVGLGVSQVSKYLVDGVVVACDNSPSNVTLSGDLPALQGVLETIKKESSNVLARLLKVDIAYHSHQMSLLTERYKTLLEAETRNQGAVCGNPVVQFWSSVTGGCIRDGQELGSEYFTTNLISQARFNTAVQRLIQAQPDNFFIEIGPHSTLADPLRQICSAKGVDYNYVPTMQRGEDCVKSALTAVGQLYQNGITLNYETLYPGGRVLSNLPQYAWKRNGAYWYESRLSKEWRLRKVSHHKLLGLRVPESTTFEPIWRNMLSLGDGPWLMDHKIVNDVVFPFAGYLTMAGAAVRQITGVDGGYRIRCAIAHTALVLWESTPVEIITTLRQHKSSDLSHSMWFEFTISSFSGSTWIRNCQGQVRPYAQALPHQSAPKAELSRQINSLFDIKTSTTTNLAVAKIASPTSYSQSECLFHPGSIDACLQLLLVAIAKGIGRNIGDLRVPTTIEDLIISHSSQEMDAVAWSNGLNDVAVDCMARGRPVLQLRGLQLTPVDNSSKTSTLEPHAAARLEWHAHFDLVDHFKLFKPPPYMEDETWMQEEMSLLCMLGTAEWVRDLKASRPHFEKFRDWLDMEIKRAADGTYPLLGKEAQKFVMMSSSARDELIVELQEKLTEMSARSSVAIGIRRIYDNCPRIFTGEADTLDILMEDSVLTHIYDACRFIKGTFFRTLCHSRPMLRILEVGAGAGGATEMIFKELIGQEYLPCYSLYTFTDISAGFFPQAKKRFSNAPNMEYRLFDISKSPFEQGFERDTYDVILAANVVHATPSLNKTLTNLQPLLNPGGLLVLTELCPEIRTLNYMFGNFSEWWLGEADDRPYEPYVSVERWDEELKRAGFSGADTAVCDAKPPYRCCVTIVSRKLLTVESKLSTSHPVTVLCNRPESSISKRFIDDLTRSGPSVTVCRLGETPATNQDIISLLDIEGHFFEEISVEQLVNFQKILSNDRQNSPILWLVRPTQIKCRDPRSGHAIGVARSIRAESSVPFYTLEISEEESEFANIVTSVWKNIRYSNGTGLLCPDKEFAVDDGVIKVGRYLPFLVKRELCGSRITDNRRTSYSLEISATGQLNTLQWVQESFESKVGGDEILVSTVAVGLNFKDVLHATGILRTGNDNIPLGLEVSGVVCRVRVEVKDFSLGDRVLAMPPAACAKTAVVVPASLVQRIPDSLGFEDAATMPVCYSAAIESLINLGSLQKGQSVLIHSATGGVGQAAIQICRIIGAEIYATVGNGTKVQYLMSTFEIPRDHIFCSRDESFATNLMQVTKQRGVDVVLNSLSGELLHASWDCVAEFGKMIDLRKEDGIEFGKLQMKNFLLNRSYSCVDMTHLAQKRPEQVRVILKKIVDLYSAGKIKPLAPVTPFEAKYAESAFRHVQNGDHIGKVVLTGLMSSPAVPTVSRANKLQLNQDVSYLLTGGLGGLGRLISTWLVERGARSLVFLSRSADSTESHGFLRELESTGCTVTVVPGKAESAVDIHKAISKAPSPIRGVIHLAIVLKDSSIATMTHADWHAANAPKQLPRFLRPRQLPRHRRRATGQGSYSAANTYLEAFTQWRRSQSLPASILNICPIHSVGFVAENSFARENMKAEGVYFLGESELLDFIELSILTSPPPSGSANASLSEENAASERNWSNSSQIIMGLRSEGDLNDPETRTNWRRDIRMGFYHNITTKSTHSDEPGSSNRLKAFLASACDDPKILSKAENVKYLATEIGRRIYGLTMKNEENLDLSLSLTQVGLDSSMAIELRRWWKTALGLEISVLGIMATGSIEALGKVAGEQLRARHADKGNK